MKTTTTLEGQTVLIIGGTSGIGFGVAVAALTNDAAKVIIASSNPERVKIAVERLKSQVPGRGVVEGVVVDGRDLVNLEGSIKQVGQINHLVFTAGGAISGAVGNIAGIDVNGIKGKSMQSFSVIVISLSEDNLFDVRLWGSVQAAKSAIFPPEGGSITLTSGK